MEGDSVLTQSPEDVLKILGNLQTAVDATASSANPLLTKARNNDESLDTSSGLSLLLLRPQILLNSLHNLVILLALRLSSGTEHTPDHTVSTAFTTPFTSHLRDRRELDGLEDVVDEIGGELLLNQEVMEKVRGMEGKLEYQIKKLIGLAEAEEKRGKEVVEDAGEDPLSFRPNPSALVSSTRAPASGSAPTARQNRNQSGRGDSDDEDSSNQVYRPPRVAAVPYNDQPSSSRRKERRAPALLSEFAATMDGAPLLESTSGLATRPVQLDKQSNSISAKRAAELARMDQFEEENMTRLVTTKREAKRRREDEEALALGYGVGGPARSRGRRQNGLEAELEGVLGERGSKGLWEGISKTLGKRGTVMERVKGGVTKQGGDGGKRKKARFEKEVKGHSRRSG